MIASVSVEAQSWSLSSDNRKTFREDVKPKSVDIEGNRLYDCPICHSGDVLVREDVFYGRCDNCGATLIDYLPFPHQEAFHKSKARFRLNIGGFGCHNPEAKILMYDGSIKQAKDINVGEQLMGDDGTPRNVLERHEGYQPRYAVHIKKQGKYLKPLYFNEGHILHLEYSNFGNDSHKYDGQFSQVTIKEYIQRTERYKSNHKWVFSRGFELPHKDVPLDPYFLGLLLGDGSFRNNRVDLTTTDDIILNYFPYKKIHYDKRNDVKNIRYDNNIRDIIDDLGLLETLSDTKFIPEIYKINSKEVRRGILAGLIDSDGYYAHGNYEITLKSERMIDDIAYICKSLGIRVTKTLKKVKIYPENNYWRLILRGEELENLPIKLKRKQSSFKPNKKYYLQGFKIEKVSDYAPYVGFTVDNNNLYIEGEHFSVVHNSGKTTASCAEAANHCLERANSRFLITAISLKQIKDAVMPELMKFLPPWFIKKYTTNPTPNIKLTNGSEILIYSSENPDNLRSLNLTGFYIEEASGVKYEIFDQLTTRLRNKAGIIFDEDGNEVDYRFMGILCTNPEDGWIKDDFLLKSGRIVTSPSIDINIYKPLLKEPLEKHYHSFISSTRDNTKLPKTYLEGMCAGKSERWIRKYVDCYLDNKEGAVFPDYTKNIVEPFRIPKDWKRLVGFDPGYNDPTAIPKGAIDPKTGIIYIYDDYKVSNMPISYHAKQLSNDIRGFELLIPIQADPSVQKRNDRDGISYADYFRQRSGLYLEPANNDILYGIEKVRDYMENGKLKFFSSCNNLKEEAMNYAYPKKDKNTNDLPVDNFNHLWDAIRYIIAKLPRDPNQLNAIYIQKDTLNNTYSAFAGSASPHDVYLPDYNDVYGGWKLE
jgi:PBSX family phage terminase large subunit